VQKGLGTSQSPEEKEGGSGSVTRFPKFEWMEKRPRGFYRKKIAMIGGNWKNGLPIILTREKAAQIARAAAHSEKSRRH